MNSGLAIVSCIFGLYALWLLGVSILFHKETGDKAGKCYHNKALQEWAATPMMKEAMKARRNRYFISGLAFLLIGSLICFASFKIV